MNTIQKKVIFLKINRIFPAGTNNGICVCFEPLSGSYPTVDVGITRKDEHQQESKLLSWLKKNDLFNCVGWEGDSDDYFLINKISQSIFVFERPTDWTDGIDVENFLVLPDFVDGHNFNEKERQAFFRSLEDNFQLRNN